MKRSEIPSNRLGWRTLRRRWRSLLAALTGGLGPRGGLIAGKCGGPTPVERPDDVSALVDGAKTLINARRFEEADRVLSEALTRHPNHLALFECLAGAAQQGERWVEALDRWRSLAERWPNNVNARLQIANILIRIGQCREAERVLEEALAQWPDHLLLMKALARAAQRGRRWPDALAHWQALSQIHPNQVEAWINRVKILERLQRFTEAEQILCIAAERWPDHPKLIEALALVAQRGLRWGDALAHWQELTERRPGHINAWVRRIKALLELQRLEEAKDVLVIAMERWPDHPKMQEAMANALESEQRWTEALSCWRNLSNSHPDHARSHVGQRIAICEIKLGRVDDAGRSLEEAVGVREEAVVFERLFGPYARFISYYGRQIEDDFRDLG